MKVNEPIKKSNLVQVGLIPQGSAFKDKGGTYFIVLDMQFCYFEHAVKSTTEIDYEGLWVFNVRTDTLGIFDEYEMVEPVELEVTVKGKA